MDEDWPLITYLLKAKAIKPSHEIQNYKSKKAFKFNFVLITQNTNLWKTSFGENFIPTIYLDGSLKLLFVFQSDISNKSNSII